MFATLTSREESLSFSGILCYHDEQNVFSEQHVPHIQILRETATDVSIGARFPPMTFFEVMPGDEIKMHSGFLVRDAGSCIFRSVVEGELDVSTEGYTTANSRLFQTAEERSRQPVTLVWGQIPKLQRCNYEEIVAGPASVKLWVACYTLGRCMITKGFFEACSEPLETFQGDIRRRVGKRPASPNARKWNMWYPSPKPIHLESWLSFVASGQGYNVEDIVELSPVNEGFYRIGISRPRGCEDGVVVVKFDDGYLGSAGAQMPAEIVANDLVQGSLFLRVNVPLTLRVPGDKRPDIWSRAYKGSGEDILCYVLPDSILIDEARFGPSRSAFSSIWERNTARDKSGKDVGGVLERQASHTLLTLPLFPKLTAVRHNAQEDSHPAPPPRTKAINKAMSKRPSYSRTKAISPSTKPKKRKGEGCAANSKGKSRMGDKGDARTEVAEGREDQAQNCEKNVSDVQSDSDDSFQNDDYVNSEEEGDAKQLENM